MEYPKINSLYKRAGMGPLDPVTGKYACGLEKRPHTATPLIIGEYACPEFAAIKQWTVTEKVDGTNVRVIFNKVDPKMDFKGRTEDAQFPTFLFTYLRDIFTYEKMKETFKESNYIILFGEGYGPKIQCGGYYRRDPGFILFDVFCSGWWLTRDSVAEVAGQLGIEHCPIMNRVLDARVEEFESWNKNKHLWTTEQIHAYVQSKPKSLVAKVEAREMEGVVARSEPQMMFRKGGPIMFKLKCKDF